MLLLTPALGAGRCARNLLVEYGSQMKNQCFVLHGEVGGVEVLVISRFASS